MKRSLRIVSILVGALLVLLFASIAFAQDAGVAPSIAVTTNVTNTAPAQLPAAAVTVAQLVLSLLGFALWEAWLGATKRISANSTGALVVWVVRTLIDAAQQAAKRPPGPMAPALILLLLAASGCHQVVRDANVYKQELRFLGEGGARVAAGSLGAAGDRAKAGDPAGCAKLATAALVVQARFPYHVAKALHLAGLGDDPGPTPPPVPDVTAWCRERGL